MRSGALRLDGASGRGGAPAAYVLPAALLLLALVGWWWSVQMAPEMDGGGHGAMTTEMDGGGHGAMTAMETGMSLGAFVVAWLAMMAAMMLPAVLPVVRLYARAAALGRAAPTAFFVLGYLAVWAAVAAPAYLAWRGLEGPLADGSAWVARVAGVTFLAAAIWQLTPVKTACLRHCRSPVGFFMRFGRSISRPLGAARMGALHGAFCFGCCWAIFAVLVVLGTMNLAWMVALTALIVLEKNAPRGDLIAPVAGVAFAVVGVLLLADTSLLMHLT